VGSTIARANLKTVCSVRSDIKFYLHARVVSHIAFDRVCVAVSTWRRTKYYYTFYVYFKLRPFS